MWIGKTVEQKSRSTQAQAATSLDGAYRIPKMELLGPREIDGK